MEMGRWGGRTFTVTSRVMRSFSGLTVKGSSETEDKKENNQSYVSRKSGKPAEISMSVLLHAALNVDVRAEAMAFVADAQAGRCDYLYIGSAKLVTCQVMLTDAEVTETTISPNGTWISVMVKLTFKQCSRFEGQTETKQSGGWTGAKLTDKAKEALKQTGEDIAEAIKKGIAKGLVPTTGQQVEYSQIDAEKQVAQTAASVAQGRKATKQYVSGAEYSVLSPTKMLAMPGLTAK